MASKSKSRSSKSGSSKSRSSKSGSSKSKQSLKQKLDKNKKRIITAAAALTALGLGSGLALKKTERGKALSQKAKDKYHASMKKLYKKLL